MFPLLHHRFGIDKELDGIDQGDQYKEPQSDIHHGLTDSMRKADELGCFLIGDRQAADTHDDSKHHYGIEFEPVGLDTVGLPLCRRTVF